VKIYNVGLVGFGNVNRAFVNHYLSIKEKIAQCYGFKLKFVAVCDSRSFIHKINLNILDLIQRKEKSSSIGREIRNPLNRFANIIKSKKIDILIDGMPSSKVDEGLTYPLLVKALKRKITVVCVNKAPLVYKGENLLKIAKTYNARIGISGTAAGSLPSSGIVINELIESGISSVRGILNGTCNYVLDRMMFGGLNIYEAVKKAVEIGIAEPDYRFDLEGTDTCFKMIILGLLITGRSISPKEVPCTGIMNLRRENIESVVKKGKAMRLIGNLSIEDNRQKISVAPEMLDKEDPLFDVRGSGKGITFKTKYMGDLTIIGSSSGRTNIAATILKDIINAIKR